MAKAKYTAIGGQALIEGIMMKSPEKTALAVRCPDKNIDITYLNGKSVRERVPILKLPILRGIAGFLESMIQGYKAMMISADKSGMTDLEDEKEKEKEASRRTFFQSPHYLFSAFDRHWGSRSWHICKKSD